MRCNEVTQSILNVEHITATFPFYRNGAYN